MTWRIAVSEGSGYPLVCDVLTAQWAWKRLTPIQRAAIARAYPQGGAVVAAPPTLRALHRHGFIEIGDGLTEAGKAVARWCVK